MNYTVYLAGGISGIPKDVYRAWRDKVTKELWEEGQKYKTDIYTLDPCNSDDWLRESGYTSKETFEDSTRKKDLYDVARCDLVFVNFLPSTQVSKGTLIEIGYAMALNKPIVIVMNKGNIHEHTFVYKGDRVFKTDDLDIGIQIATNLLLPK